MLSAWGSTETAPMATSVHWRIRRAGVIGLPAPGTAIKLAPSASKLELRVKGPNVTPGYWKRPDLTAAAFDEEGFFRMGDAGQARRSRRSGAGHRLRRPHRRGLQAGLRHLGPRRRAAHGRRRRGRSSRAGRGGRRPRSGRAGAARLPQPPRVQATSAPTSPPDELAAHGPRSRAFLAGAYRRYNAREPDEQPPRSPGLLVLAEPPEHRRQRDHRQGLHQPARRAGAPRGARGAALLDGPRGDPGRLSLAFPRARR